MKNTDHTQSRESLGVLLRLTAGACLVATGLLLAGCAYTETMREREAEGQQLRSELEYETARTRSLTR